MFNFGNSSNNTSSTSNNLFSFGGNAAATTTAPTTTSNNNNNSSGLFSANNNNTGTFTFGTNNNNSSALMNNTLGNNNNSSSLNLQNSSALGQGTNFNNTASLGNNNILGSNNFANSTNQSSLFNNNLNTTSGSTNILNNNSNNNNNSFKMFPTTPNTFNAFNNSFVPNQSSNNSINNTFNNQFSSNGNNTSFFKDINNNPQIDQLLLFNNVRNNQLNFKSNSSENINSQKNMLSFDLQPHNTLKYEKLNNILTDEYKNAVFRLQENLLNNEIYFENSESLLNNLEENKNIMLKECSNIIDLTKNVSSHNKNCSYLVNNLNKDLNNQINLLVKIKKNINVLDSNSGVKIDVPNEQFEKSIKDLNFKVENSLNKVKELESIIISTQDNNINDNKNYNEITIIEDSIIEMFEYLNYLNQENDSLENDLKKLKSKYVNKMRDCGYDDKEIEKRYVDYLNRIAT